MKIRYWFGVVTYSYLYKVWRTKRV